jgi:signal transduction histidine kinase
MPRRLADGRDAQGIVRSGAGALSREAGSMFIQHDGRGSDFIPGPKRPVRPAPTARGEPIRRRAPSTAKAQRASANPTAPRPVPAAMTLPSLIGVIAAAVAAAIAAAAFDGAVPYRALGLGAALALIGTVAAVLHRKRSLRPVAALNEALEHSRREREQAELTASRMAAILEGACDGVCQVDPDGFITYANQQCRTLLAGGGELVGLALPEALPASSAAAFASACSRSRVEGEPVCFDEHLMPMARWVSVRVMPSRDGLVISFRDITTRREADQRIERAEAARAEAERKLLDRSRLIATASHDLRQPVQSLLFLGTALAEGLRDHPMAPLATGVNQAAEALKLLFDGMLDLSKLDTGAVKPEPADIPLGALLDRLGAEYGHRAEMCGLRLAVVGSSAWVRSDAVPLERILRNLIENALRYTTEGRVLIGCRRIGRDRIRVDVLDTGTGFPADQAEIIFEAFHRGMGQVDGGDGSHGLGLAIVRRLAEALGHGISVDSVPGRGSRFSVELPLAATRA